MPPFLQRALSGLISNAIASAVIDWFGPFVRTELVANKAEYDALATRITDAAYVNALILKAVDALPMEESFRVFHKTVRIPIKSVISPSTVALLLLAIGSKEQAALDRAHTALTDAYRAALNQRA